ncbi:hypothetical protein ACFW0H_10900 [Pseudomonas sp. CR3202]|uniref:hypothetical protein n=1 Tax=Pseudomonas sp. CR3202 TaxID=3351532 RepID=UPI003BF354FD
MKSRGQKMEVHIGVPIDAGQYSVERLGELMADTRGRMQELLGQASSEVAVLVGANSFELGKPRP